MTRCYDERETERERKREREQVCVLGWNERYDGYSWVGMNGMTDVVMVQYYAHLHPLTKKSVLPDMM